MISRSKTTFGLIKRRAVLVIAFLLAFSVTLSFATPLSSPYTPGDTLDPGCAPNDTNCTVSIFPDQVTNANKFLMTDGAGNLSWSKSGSLLQTNGVNNGSQSVFNLASGTGVALNDNGSGRITISSLTPSYSFSNGLVNSGTSIKLGGALTENTTINGNFDLRINNGTFSIGNTQATVPTKLDVKSINEQRIAIYAEKKGNLSYFNDGIAILGKRIIDVSTSSGNIANQAAVYSELGFTNPGGFTYNGTFPMGMAGFVGSVTMYSNSGNLNSGNSLFAGGTYILHVAGSGNINRFADMRLAAPKQTPGFNNFSGTINDFYALLIEDAHATGHSITNEYGVYQEGLNAMNVFNGNVSIGVGADPTFTLEVGRATTTGVVARFRNHTGTCDINPTTSSLGCSSDVTLKKNITLLENDSADFELKQDIDISDLSTFEKVLALTPVRYNWINENSNTAKHTGFIAQEVEQIFPDLVSTDVDGLKSMNYAGMTPILTRVIQEMDLKIVGIADLTKKNTWRDSLIDWFGNKKNGIGSIFSKKVQTDELCVGNVCVTEDQFLNMMQKNDSSTGVVDNKKTDTEGDSQEEGQEETEDENKEETQKENTESSEYTEDTQEDLRAVDEVKADPESVVSPVLSIESPEPRKEEKAATVEGTASKQTK